MARVDPTAAVAFAKEPLHCGCTAAVDCNLELVEGLALLDPRKHFAGLCLGCSFGGGTAAGVVLQTLVLVVFAVQVGSVGAEELAAGQTTGCGEVEERSQLLFQVAKRPLLRVGAGPQQHLNHDQAVGWVCLGAALGKKDGGCEERRDAVVRASEVAVAASRDQDIHGCNVTTLNG